MVDFPEDFNPNDVPEDDRSFEPIPAGDYAMQVIESDIKPTKSGSGDQLILTLEVTEGPMTNRRIWDRLNIRNQNADAQRIAQRALADLCLAVGVASLRNTEELHFKPFVGRVTIKQDKTGQYGPQNAVRYKPRGGQPPAGKAAAQPAARPAATTQAAKPAAGARPWANRNANKVQQRKPAMAGAGASRRDLDDEIPF
jgi:hypothetical protein